MRVHFSVIIPVFNEEKNFVHLHSRLSLVFEKLNVQNYELIFVNDGSKDQTLAQIKIAAAKDERIKYLSFSRNFGHQIAVCAGLEQSKGEIIVIIDGDLQDPPELIEDLYQKYHEGYKVVYARRKLRKGETFFKRFTAKWFYRILAVITQITIPIDVGDFRLMDRQVLEVLLLMGEQQKFLRGQIAWIGFSQTFVDYERDPRKYGNTGYSLGKMLKLALDGITSFSNFPLKVASFLGFLASIVSFLVLIYSLIAKYIFQSTFEGWTSLIASIVFIGGIQLFCIGIIGEYIGRIYNDVRKRPLYVVEDSNINPSL